MNAAEILYTYQEKKQTAPLIPEAAVLPPLPTVPGLHISQKLGIALMVIAVGAMLGAFSPIIRSEANYRANSLKNELLTQVRSFWTRKEVPLQSPLAEGQPKPELASNPLIGPDGTKILPNNTDFAIIIPKLGINALIVPGVNPVDPNAYGDALKKGVAHSSTSFYPNEKGAVYLFSHSTNYEWFVDDLNAIFYLVKDLEPGDRIVLIYLGHRYTYQVSDQQVVSSREISYLAPIPGLQRLILQTCWPPGTTLKRLMVFAELIDERPYIPGM